MDSILLCSTSNDAMSNRSPVPVIQAHSVFLHVSEADKASDYLQLHKIVEFVFLEFFQLLC